MLESLQTVLSLILQPLGYVIEPEKRIFLGYLLPALLMGFVFIYVKNKDKNIISNFKQTLNLPAYISPSGLLDIKLLFVNHVFRVFILLPLLGSQLVFAFWIHRSLYSLLGEAPNWQINIVVITALFTLIIFIVEDFSRFILHYAMHRLPILWRFHRIHHSAESLTPLTLYRFHPIESLLLAIRNIIALGCVSGVFLYCFSGQIQVYEIIGVNALNVMFSFFAANLRHSHIPLSFGKLESYFISPAQHQVHHSIEKQHFDKNFGTILAVWDRLFHSWLPGSHEQKLHFGLPSFELPMSGKYGKYDKQSDSSKHGLITNLSSPFVKRV